MKSGLKRIELLDGLRGAAIIGMVLHHLAYDLEIFYDIAVPLIHTDFFRAIQLLGVLIFIMISGICTGFSRSSLRRGAIVFAVAMGLTLFGLIFMPDSVVRFGILHFMGCAMVIYALTHSLFRRIPWKIGFSLFAILFILAYWILSPFGITIDVPGLFALGLPSHQFYSADYYPLLPWLFAFFAGSYLSRPILDQKFPRWFYNMKLPVLQWVGRYSLYIYVLHQPVVFGVLWLILGRPAGF